MNKYRKWFLIPTIVGILGTALFFPVHLGSQYTCLFHRIMMSSWNPHEMYPGHGDLIDIYVFPFGVIWWISVGLVVLGVYLKLGNRTSRNSELGKEKI